MSRFATPPGIPRIPSSGPPASRSLDRIVRVYDRAIAACERVDAPAARETLSLLRAALELDTPAARGFDALYAWCEEAISEGDFVGPERCLRSLRDAWCRAVEPDAIFPRTDLPPS
ncbi:MAG TPA: hypothetical protein VE869_12865 [Gemmatimonas sp.]|nr:hypothetical protein [Gemmatimonas sp.]